MTAKGGLEPQFSDGRMPGAGGPTPDGRRTIGAEFRRERETRGISLASVAQHLRIREEYLRAIETGQHDVLPGRVYGIGFVRGYATLLGFDGDEAVERFKAEAGGIDRATALAFPSPPPEGRVPGRAVLISSLIAAVAIYGAWYTLSSPDRVALDLVPAVPDRLARLVDRNPAPPGASPIYVSRPDPGQAAASSDPRIPAVAAVTSPPASPPAPRSTEPQRPEAAPSGIAPPTDASAGESARAEDDEEDDGVRLSPEPIRPGLSSSPGAAPASPAAQPQIASAPMATTALLREPGESRVVIRATDENWVQLRASDNSPVLTRILKRGESLKVPALPGLTLFTGNAGALDIVVDGESVPPIGAVGMVRRNVALDAERLRAGTAVPRH
jgi:cytoskeleton protein RodZ